VFVLNLAPGAADRLGAATADLRTRHSRLITCAISGYGSSGPYAQKKAYDMLIQAETGLLSITGTPESPSRVGISVADIAAGMYAYSAIVTALLVRTSSGRGTAIDVSLFDALGEWMGAPSYYSAYGGSEPPRCGAAHATIAPYELFVSRDGVEVYLAIQNAREWSRFCDFVLNRTELTDDRRFHTNAARVHHRQALHDIIAEVFAGLDSSEVLDRLELADIACARENSIGQFLDHPQLVGRDRWSTIDSPVGPLRALLPPVLMEGFVPVMGAVPSLGQHSQAILEELGYDADTIEGWRKEQMI
jgi:crotonobetainyl-CoA:carnitine CoA-transferase CaiB-like acyl-CoA transferase